MRNDALAKLEGLVGECNLTLSDVWFIEEGWAQVHGWATFEWLGDVE